MGLRCLLGFHDWHPVWWDSLPVQKHHDRECYRCGRVEFRD